MLVVRPVEHADVAQCIAIRVAALGSLVIGRPPPYPGYIEEAEAAVHANLDDPDTFVRHLKVVDPADEGEVMAYAKWELYPNGRSKESLEKLKEPMSEEDKNVDQYGTLREAAHEYFSTRNGEMGKQPHLRRCKPLPLSLRMETNAKPSSSSCASCDRRATQETGRWESAGEMGS
jgi:hypothetical protein